MRSTSEPFRSRNTAPILARIQLSSVPYDLSTVAAQRFGIQLPRARGKSLSIAIGRALRPFPRSKRSRPVSRHSAFQLGQRTLTGRTCRCRPWSAPAGQAAVICFLHFVRWRSFCVAYPGSLRRVRPITVRHLTTMLPLPSVPHAGIFASLAGTSGVGVP